MVKLKGLLDSMISFTMLLISSGKASKSMRWSFQMEAVRKMQSFEISLRLLLIILTKGKLWRYIAEQVWVVQVL